MTLHIRGATALLLLLREVLPTYHSTPLALRITGTSMIKDTHQLYSDDDVELIALLDCLIN
jgi:hypothetical protein